MGVISEGALAEVVEGMGLLNRAEMHLNHLESRLQECRVEVDKESFKHVRFYLDQIFSQISTIPLEVAEAKTQPRKASR